MWIVSIDWEGFCCIQPLHKPNTISDIFPGSLVKFNFDKCFLMFKSWEVSLNNFIRALIGNFIGISYKGNIRNKRV